MNGWYTCLLYHEILPPGLVSGAAKPIYVAQDYADILPPPLCLEYYAFEAQMRWLANSGLHILTLDEILDFHAGRKDLPPGSVLLSFDDLWTGVRDYALPILQECGLKAVAFCVRDWLFPARGSARADSVCALGLDDLPVLAGTFTLANHGAALHTRTTSAAVLSATKAEFLADYSRCADFCASLGGYGSVYAWPFGQSSVETQQGLSESGCNLAFGTSPGRNTIVSNPRNLHRTLVRGGIGLDEFCTLLAP